MTRESPKIFLAYYRRSSQAITRKIYQHLVEAYGSEAIFFDESSIPLGVDVREYIRNILSKCVIVLAVIDEYWLQAIVQNSSVQNGPNSWINPKDWTRLELEEALESGNINVVPILVDGVDMPRPELLPNKLKEISYRNSFPLSSEYIDEGMRALVRSLNRILDLSSERKTSPLSIIAQRARLTRQGYIEPLLAVNNNLPLHMVLISGGAFSMGSPEEEQGRSDREEPQRIVNLSSFFMGCYPITQTQYAMLMESNPATSYNNDRFVAPNKPVVGVSWHDAVEFCQRLSKSTGRPYRLPTEAEWEYACRAGTTTPFYFGKTITTEVANFDGNYTYANGPKGEFRNVTTSADYFGIANAFGLSDMHGNVSEWCQDYWHENYENAPTDGTAWVEGGNPSYRVRRGGSWFFEPAFCRSAYRDDFGLPELSDSHIGFRVCCSAPAVFQ